MYVNLAASQSPMSSEKKLRQPNLIFTKTELQSVCYFYNLSRRYENKRLEKTTVENEDNRALSELARKPL